MHGQHRPQVSDQRRSRGQLDLSWARRSRDRVVSGHGCRKLVVRGSGNALSLRQRPGRGRWEGGASQLLHTLHGVGQNLRVGTEEGVETRLRRPLLVGLCAGNGPHNCQGGGSLCGANKLLHTLRQGINNLRLGTEEIAEREAGANKPLHTARNSSGALIGKRKVGGTEGNHQRHRMGKAMKA